MRSVLTSRWLFHRADTEDNGKIIRYTERERERESERPRGSRLGHTNFTPVHKVVWFIHLTMVFSMLVDLGQIIIIIIITTIIIIIIL
jgi:hypothetical protein